MTAEGWEKNLGRTADRRRAGLGRRGSTMTAEEREKNLDRRVAP